MPRRTKHAADSVQSAKGRLQLRRAESADEWAGFVPCNIDEAEKAAFEQWYHGDDQAVWGYLSDSLFEGFKLSTSFDKANDCYICSLAGRPDRAGEVEYSAVLTARASDFNTAVALLVYKHDVILGRDWWTAINQPKQNRMQFG